jgi:hypothetical protein
MDFLPAVEMIEQLCRRTLRSRQRRLDVVILQQPEQSFRLDQLAGEVMIDHEFLAEQFGAAVDEGRNTAGDQMAADLRQPLRRDPGLAGQRSL